MNIRIESALGQEPNIERAGDGFQPRLTPRVEFSGGKPNMTKSTNVTIWLTKKPDPRFALASITRAISYRQRVPYRARFAELCWRFETEDVESLNITLKEVSFIKLF